MRLVRIALCQIRSHPALVAGSLDLLDEPFVPSARGSLARTGFFGVDVDALQQRCHTDYVDWARARQSAIHEYLSPLQPDLVLLPELSVPTELLPDVSAWSAKVGCVVLAGTHTPLRRASARKRYHAIGIDDKDLNKLLKYGAINALPIIRAGTTTLVAKRHHSPFEQLEVGLSEPALPMLAPLRIKAQTEFTVLPLICSEALRDHNVAESYDIAAIVAYERSPARFQPFIDQRTANKHVVALCNDGSHGGTRLAVVTDARRPPGILSLLPQGLPPGDSLLVVDVDLDALAIEVGVSSPAMNTTLVRLADIVAERSSDHERSAAFAAIRHLGEPAARESELRKLADDPKATPLLRLRADQLAAMEHAGASSEQYWEAWGVDCTVAGRPPLAMLEAELAAACVSGLTDALPEIVRIGPERATEALSYLAECQRYAPKDHTSAHQRAMPQELQPAPSLAKVARPWLPPIFARTRLFERLDAARARPVVWIEGPPGAGKTTLVASYIEERGLRAVWYQVDEGDGEPATFLNYLALAAGPLMSSKGGLPQVTAENASSIAILARRWFRELYAALPTPFVVVLDNYQSVPPSSAFHAIVRDGLEELPPGGNAIIVSRAEPGPALARLRARGAVEVVGSDALKLTPEESLGVVRVRGGAASDEVASLHDRIQGWAAGLVLLLERTGDDTASTVADEPPQTVFDFFAGEIFDQAEADTRQVLLETALLPAVRGSMAIRLTGIASAGDVLATLARRGYFTQRSGREDPSYQYHPLFREFLLARAKASYPPHRLAELRLSAARMLREGGEIDLAMALYEEAGGWEELADCLVAEARLLYRAGRIETLVRWISRVPEEMRLTRPWLLYWLGRSKTLLNPVNGHRDAEKAFDRFWELGDVRGAYFTAVFAGGSSAWVQIWHGATDLQRLDTWIDRFESLHARYPAAPSETVKAHADAAMAHAILIGRPQHPAYRALEEQAYRFAAGNGPLEQRITLSMLFAQASVWKGEVERMQALVDSIGPRVRRGGIPAFSALTWYGIEGIHHAMSGAPEAAKRSIRLAVKVANAAAIHGWHLTADVVSALSSIAADNISQARTALGRAQDLTPHRRVPTLDLATGLLLARVGRHGDALERADALKAFGEKAHIPWLVMFGHLLAGSVLLAGGRNDAQVELAAARQVARANGSVLADYVAGMVEAAAKVRATDTAGAAESLPGPMALGRQRRFAPHLWLTPGEIAALCRVARQHCIEPEYCQWLEAKR